MLLTDRGVNQVSFCHAPPRKGLELCEAISDRKKKPAQQQNRDESHYRPPHPFPGGGAERSIAKLLACFILRHCLNMHTRPPLHRERCTPASLREYIWHQRITPGRASDRSGLCAPRN